MPRLLSKTEPKKITPEDDTYLKYYKESPFSVRSIIMSDEEFRNDDWNIAYDSPHPIFYEDTPFLFEKCFNKKMPRLLSIKSPKKNSNATLGNTLDEIKYIRSVLSEIGPEPSDAEIDRAITLAKVDEFQERMEKFYDPEMVKNK